MNSDMYQEIKCKIDLIYDYVANSKNNSLIKKLDEKKEQIYQSIPKAQSQILQNKQNREYIQKYLNNFITFVSDKKNLIEQGFFKLIRQSQITKMQNIFNKKFTQLPSYFKSLETQDISATDLNLNQDVAYYKIPVNFTVSSYVLDDDQNFIVCITLIFKDIYDEEIYIHTLNTQKLLKKIPELQQFEYLKSLKNYLTITVNQQKEFVILESLDPIIQFSPIFKPNKYENQQEFYLSNDMEIIISPTYKIKILQIFNKIKKDINQNLISQNYKNEYDGDDKLVKNVENSIILQPIEQNINHQQIVISNLKESILLNSFLGLPKDISVQLIHDGIGFLFEVLNERPNFYTSLSCQSSVQSKTKKFNFNLIINNQIRLQIDSECGQQYFDSNEYNRNLLN